MTAQENKTKDEINKELVNLVAKKDSGDYETDQLRSLSEEEAPETGEEAHTTQHESHHNTIHVIHANQKFHAIDRRDYSILKRGLNEVRREFAKEGIKILNNENNENLPQRRKDTPEHIV